MPTSFPRWKTSIPLIGKPHEYNANGQFIRYINVLHSERVPSPIFAAIFSGAPWRWLQIPDEVLRRRNEAQFGYVRWRCRNHFDATEGRCYLFGRITGFEWVKAQNDIVVLDSHGRVVSKVEQETPFGRGSLTIGGKTIPGSILR
jgi:hypothetical protein